MRLALAALISLLLAAPASASTADQILGELAARQTHGWQTIAGGIDYPAMEATIAAGGRVYVPCGVVSILAKRALDRAGIPSRLVGAFSNTTGQDLYDVPAGTLESHAMIEAWDGERWVLYDVDGNVKAVDENGAGVGIEQFAQARRYEPLTDPATDPAFELAGSPHPVYEQWLFDNHEAWYDRVLDTIAIMPNGGHVYYFTDPALKDRLDPMTGYEWVDDTEWRAVLNAAPTTMSPPKPRPPVTVPAPVRVVPPVVKAPKIVPAKPATRRGCKRFKRRYERTHSRRALRKYRRCRSRR